MTDEELFNAIDTTPNSDKRRGSSADKGAKDAGRFVRREQVGTAVSTISERTAV